jgi:hypothetical protein
MQRARSLGEESLLVSEVRPHSEVRKTKKVVDFLRNYARDP